MRLLWLKTELLHPVDKGGKIRTYQMLRELKRDCHITYLTLDDGTADRGGGGGGGGGGGEGGGGGGRGGGGGFFLFFFWVLF
jgi:hypothetical protein